MIEIRNIEKNYLMGETDVHALRGVSLRIDEGDFVAILGPSGSGKSTLAHILGLLDVPSSGSYLLNGREISNHSEDELAVLRRNTIGFVFQQFNLLPRLNAEENISLPLFYSKKEKGMSAARKLLAKVGLESRNDHRPNQLSGGQQQRVAIARAIINRPKIILADEPTGNLDSKTGKEILAALHALNADGVTVIIVTHDEAIAAQAKRRIRLSDGLIESDERTVGTEPSEKTVTSSEPSVEPTPLLLSFFSDIAEHFIQAYRTLRGNKVRTLLSMLGILIGVAAVVVMLAIGRAAKTNIESQLNSLGSNLLTLNPGAAKVGGVVREGTSNTRLTAEDADAIKELLPNIRSVVPVVNGRGQVTYGNKNWNTELKGALPSYETMKASTPKLGRFITDEDEAQRSLVALLGMKVVNELFEGKSPIGETVKINRINFLVIGVLPEKGGGGWRNQDDAIIVPLSTAMRRLLGRNYVDAIEIEVADGSNMKASEASIKNFMNRRKNIPAGQEEDAFSIINMAEVQSAMNQTMDALSYLLAAIASISLLVGGIGIMNIMLVSVTERTKEIGLRKAIGAKRADILLQFLAEAMLVTITGGVIGLLLATGVTTLISLISGWKVVVSLDTVLLSFFFSSFIGVAFGIYPARKASELAPIDALRYD